MPAHHLVVTPNRAFSNEKERLAFEERVFSVIGQRPDISTDEEYRYYLTHLTQPNGELHESVQRLLDRMTQTLAGEATVDVAEPVRPGLVELPEE